MTELAVSRPATASLSAAEERFYASYSWCASPLLTLRETLLHLDDELDRAEGLVVPWQREESLVNVYLFVCAAACTVDDYLASRRWSLKRLAARLPRLRRPAAVLERVLNLPAALRELGLDRGLVRWRSGWSGCVDAVCRELAAFETRERLEADGTGPSPRLGQAIRPFLRMRLPARVLQRRMRLPEAFRCQDLSPADVVSLARRFAASHGTRRPPVVVVGLRTAGAYFAPLVSAFLANAGWADVRWFTIRPKEAVSRWERRRLRGLARFAGSVVVVDDHPNTGHTLRLAVARLVRCGVPPERITLLVPRHAVDPAWTFKVSHACHAGVKVLTLEPGDFEVERRLDLRAIEGLLREYFKNERRVSLVDNPELTNLNALLARHARDGFHVRAKRVFELREDDDGRTGEPIRVVAKSVGCGWLGYHAYLTGRQLSGWVAPLIGLRHGLMISRWSGTPRASRFGAPRSSTIRALASYVAGRVRRLPLPNDPTFDSPGYRWTGWDEIVAMLRGVYGPYLGRLKRRAIRRRLRACLCPYPTLIDGRMGPDEWVDGPSGFVKIDHEQHNFGGAELDLADPALDLANAVFEFGLSEREERELLRGYVEASGDKAISDRLLLYHLVQGVVTMRRAAGTLAGDVSPERRSEAHRRLLAARDALVYRMNRFCGGFLSRRNASRWSDRLFLLDLDGVFDRQLLGFPHTTPCGLAALELLDANGVSVVPNTGRGIDHVRDYCRSYGLPGGLAEFGSVFLDAVNRREISLLNPRGAAQLVLFRDTIVRLPGTFLDRGYRYSVRAFRYEGGSTTCVPAAEVTAILDRCGGDALTVHESAEFTHVAAAGTGKGDGARALARILATPFEPMAAIGDSDADLEMLLASRIAYAPANCSRRIRELTETGRARLTAHPFQRGLLAAAQDLLSDWSMDGDAITRRGHHDGAAGDLVLDLLRVADRSRSRQALAALAGWRL